MRARFFPLLFSLLVLVALVGSPERVDAFSLNHVMGSVGATFEKGGRAIGNALKKGADAAGGFAQDQAEKAWHRVKKAANKVKKTAEKGFSVLQDFVKNPTGNCESFGRAVRGEMGKALGPITNSNFGRLANENIPTSFMGSAKCNSDISIGFSCGIFPYSKNIATALKQGGRVAKGLSHRVGNAWKGLCKHVNVLARGNCAVAVAIAGEASQGAQCMRDIAAQFGAHSGGLRKSEQQVCTETGEFLFGMGLDTAMANSAGAYAKAVGYAQKLRSALAVSGKLPLPVSCGADAFHGVPIVEDVAGVGSLNNFVRVKGKAIDVIDSWVVGTNHQVYHMSRKGWVNMHGPKDIIRIGGSKKAPWVLDGKHRIYHWVSGSWKKMPGSAVDVADGWAVAKSGVIFRWNQKIKRWDRMPGRAVRIGGTYATPWVVNRNHQIFRWNGKKWTILPGSAVDVADGWVIGTRRAGGGKQVLVWSDNAWHVIAGAQALVIGGPSDAPWVINVHHDIYKWVNE